MNESRWLGRWLMSVSWGRLHVHIEYFVYILCACAFVLHVCVSLVVRGCSTSAFSFQINCLVCWVRVIADSHLVGVTVAQLCGVSSC
jgi:hypothetical protein